MSIEWGRLMKTVLFDMDGVLLDSEKIYYDSLNHYLKSLGCIQENLSLEEFSLYTGTKSDVISANLKEKYHIEGTIDEITEGQDAYYALELDKLKKLVPMEGLVDFLEYLKQNNYKVGLASSSGLAWVSQVLNELSIEDYFDVIIHGGLVKNSKPAPDSYLLAAEKLNSQPSDCVVIEDSWNGIQAGKNADMYVIGFKGSVIEHATDNADEQCYSFKEVFNNFKNGKYESTKIE